MRHTRLTTPCWAILLLFLACISQPPVVKKGPVIQSTPQQRVAVNPLDYDTADSGIVFTPAGQETNITQSSLPEDQHVVINVDKQAWEEEKKRSLSLTEDEAHKLGFRIQVYTSTLLDSALAMKDSVARRFALQVYLEHDAPYYKIRVGNYLDYDEAKGHLEKITGFGYKEAWIVRSEICYACRKEGGADNILADTTATDEPPLPEQKKQ